ncbi:hypothetical protein ACFC3I_11510 [Bacillus velezensis]|uniref:hypothetical protein n=1 Tax=Bacillus velezensis TaxID=492670 RepID=UPI0035E2A3C4
MAAEMRVRPIVSGKDAEKFFDRVRSTNRRIEARRAQRKAMANGTNGQKETRLIKN